MPDHRVYLSAAETTVEWRDEPGATGGERALTLWGERLVVVLGSVEEVRNLLRTAMSTLPTEGN